VPSFQELRNTVERWPRFPGVERLEPAAHRFALTFDDGPDPDATPAVLEVLAAAGATATFFLVGEQVEAHPELARALVEGGHTVALHGHRHVEHDTLANPRADLEQGCDAISAATAERPALFRPPYGRFSEASYRACRELGLTPVLWSAWGCDWEPIPAERIADLVLRDLAPGRIVLLHDSARYAYRGSARATADALALILAAAREAGLAAAALGGR
jgi:peptidoglycan/xylan/chitin deacetylase (PgdA/CDA1 family)